MKIFLISWNFWNKQQILFQKFTETWSQPKKKKKMKKFPNTSHQISQTRCKITRRHSPPKLFSTSHINRHSTIFPFFFFPILTGSPSKWKKIISKIETPNSRKRLKKAKKKLGETRRAFCAYTCKNELRIVFIFFLFGERVAKNSHFRKHSWPRTLAIGLRLVGNVSRRVGVDTHINGAIPHVVHPDGGVVMGVCDSMLGHNCTHPVDEPWRINFSLDSRESGGISSADLELDFGLARQALASYPDLLPLVGTPRSYCLGGRALSVTL